MKTKQVFLGICLLLCSALFVSCEKEPITDIGVIEKELKETVEEYNLTKCEVRIVDGRTKHIDADFEIKGGFLYVEEHRYNLLYLSEYYPSHNTLICYFTNIF